MTIAAGRLQARMTIIESTMVDRPDGGQEPGTRNVLVNEPAHVEPIAADERIRQSVQYATATHRAHLRMPLDASHHVIPITPAMTATATHGYTGQTQTFTISQVTDVEGRGQELELILEERVT